MMVGRPATTDAETIAPTLDPNVRNDGGGTENVAQLAPEASAVTVRPAGAVR